MDLKAKRAHKSLLAFKENHFRAENQSTPLDRKLVWQEDLHGLTQNFWMSLKKKKKREQTEGRGKKNTW